VGRTILIADDDRVWVALLSARLTAAGFRVEAAFDAMQTVMFATKSPPDAIVLDIRMPAWTGIQALKKLKSHVKTSQIPVIVVSGESDPRLIDGLKALGAVAFLVKPVKVDDVLQALSRIFETPAIEA
jgi:CheY-like chemotaxis protein